MEQEHIDSMDVCRHPKVLKRQCMDCGQMMDSEYGVPFDYLRQDLRLIDEEITRLKDANSSKLFAEKKLQLVLDLDNTLLHSKLFQEKYLKNQTDGMFMFEPRGRLLMIKLRPLVRHFLKEVSSMFEMYIYTMGSRDYAKHMARLLRKDYFEKRVISRDDSIHKEKKSLDLVLGIGHYVFQL
ncbi:hypothetical protein LWI28_000834 [Acer negundo]|uniref:protein-serine/threonine phosphatase n=1 Tax=Acer negundo TaxID=4023 RepID=A0AAD5IU87_ACENE|nr:hypothetical protein LWI28_000834 [Acer negundo]KAK4843337.1 hypothetical protein QYF36_006914 [Acer negundo]